MTIAPASNRNRLTPLVSDLNPVMRRSVERLNASTFARPFLLGRLTARFQLFEGYRSPERQMHLFTVEKTTKARPWQSAHQYGLAVDYAIRVKNQDGTVYWSWADNAPWELLKSLAAEVGLDVPIAWDRGHVEHPAFARLKITIKP